MPTKIEWTDEVWNPVTGCTKVSAGCKHCYAERVAKRFWKDRKFTDVQFHPDRLDQPLHWRKPRRIFVCSMGDLFYEDVAPFVVAMIFDKIRECPQHTFIVLTKRIENALQLLTDNSMFCYGDPLPNLWLGVSISNQKDADNWIPLLLQVPAAKRIVSLEPMLGPVRIAKYLNDHRLIKDIPDRAITPDEHSRMYCGCLDWIICGGESGPGARPCNIEWVRSVKDQCVAAGVPFFLKQMHINGKLVKMPELDGKVWNEFPQEAPDAPTP